MSSPSVNLTVIDPGLGTTQQATNTPLLMGCCSAGPVNTVQSFNRINQVTSTLGQGPLAELAALALQLAGGPIKVMRLNATTAGAAGAVTATPIGSSTGTVTVAGAANDAYEVTIEVLSTGALGVAAFRYRLDKASSADMTGGTWSPPLVIPAGGTYAIPNTGLTLTFAPGAGPVIFEDEDVHTFVCTAPLFSTTDLAAGIAAVGTEQFAFLGLIGTHATAADGATMFAALDTHMVSFSNKYQYARAIMEAGNDTEAAVKAAFASVASSRIAVLSGTTNRASAKPFVGWGSPKMSSAAEAVRAAMVATLSDDLARVASGSAPGVTAISYDEAATGTLADTKISAMRTFVGRPGFWLDNVWLNSQPGSDYDLWQLGRVMDVACFTVYQAMMTFLSSSVRTTSTGTIDPRDAIRIEEVVKDALDVALVDPSNSDGLPHISARNFTIDQTTNVNQSKEIFGDVAIRPLGYAKTITATVGYAVNVGGES